MALQKYGNTVFWLECPMEKYLGVQSSAGETKRHPWIKFHSVITETVLKVVLNTIIIS